MVDHIVSWLIKIAHVWPSGWADMIKLDQPWLSIIAGICFQCIQHFSGDQPHRPKSRTVCNFRILVTETGMLGYWVCWNRDSGKSISYILLYSQENGSRWMDNGFQNREIGISDPLYQDPVHGRAHKGGKGGISDTWHWPISLHLTLKISLICRKMWLLLKCLWPFPDHKDVITLEMSVTISVTISLPERCDITLEVFETLSLSKRCDYSWDFYTFLNKNADRNRRRFLSGSLNAISWFLLLSLNKHSTCKATTGVCDLIFIELIKLASYKSNPVTNLWVYIAIGLWWDCYSDTRWWDLHIPQVALIIDKVRPFQIDSVFLANWLVGSQAIFKRGKKTTMQTDFLIGSIQIMLFFLGLVFPGWLVGFSITDLRETTNQFGMA